MPKTQAPDAGRLPLNGQLTHHLSAHALLMLDKISKAPAPRSSLNPGVADRLARGDLVTTVSLPSTYATHKGRLIDHLQITEAGRALLCRDGQEAERGGRLAGVPVAVFCHLGDRSPELVLELATLGALGGTFGTDEREEVYTVTFKTMTREQLDALGEFDGF